LYYYRSKYEESYQVIEELIEILKRLDHPYPKAIEIFFIKGLCEEKFGKVEEAKKSMEKCLLIGNQLSEDIMAFESLPLIGTGIIKVNNE